MTIPMVVMIVSGLLWLVMTILPGSDTRFTTWFIDVCRILFAVSALVVLWHVAGKAVI